MVTPVQRIKKAPGEKLDYGFDWQGGAPGPWLDTGDTISESTWTVPTGITEVASSKTTTTTTIRLSGGTAGETYEIENKITTSSGEMAERTFLVIVEDR